MDLIDRIRKDIQDRLETVLGEADRLRQALSALDPRSGSPPAKDGARGVRSSQPQRRSQGSRRRSQNSGGRPQRRTGTRRMPPGATKNRVLEALSDGRPRTAGEVAEATGLARGTVSSTLSKLARAKELVKAERGYRLPTDAVPGAAASTPAGDSE